MLVPVGGMVKVVRAATALKAAKVAKTTKVAKTATTATKGGVSVKNITGQTQSMRIERYIKKGEKIEDLINEAKSQTFLTGNEHAVVTLADGRRALVSGGPGGISFGEGSITRIFGHTHPTSAPPSFADKEALQILGQSKQYVYHGGEVMIVRPNP
jgi:hypothetical protein